MDYGKGEAAWRRAGITIGRICGVGGIHYRAVRFRPSGRNEFQKRDFRSPELLLRREASLDALHANKRYLEILQQSTAGFRTTATMT